MLKDTRVVILSMFLMLSFFLVVNTPYSHAQPVTSQERDSLVKKLKDPDAKVRQDAVWALGNTADRAAVPPLIAALKDTDKDVRSEAAWSLGRLKDKTAVQPLVAALKDPVASVRSAAARSLGELGDKAAVPPLIDALTDSDKDTRLEAARALGTLGDKSAISPLVAALKDTEKDPRCAAAEALGKLGWHETPKAIIDECGPILGGGVLPPPPPPPLDLKGGDKIVAFWNTWFESPDKKARVEVLKKDKTYSFVFDISKYAYFGDSSVETGVQGPIDDARKQGKAEIRFRVRPFFPGEYFRFAFNQRPEAELSVNINRLILLDKEVEEGNEKKRDKISSGEIKLRDFAEAVQAGEVRFDLRAERPGYATILVTIWDEKGMIPLDHLTLSVSVLDETQQASGRKPVSDSLPLLQGRRALLNISADFSMSGPLLADASFYIFEKSPNKKSIILFASKPADDAAGAQDAVSVYAWETESLLSEYIEKNNQFIVQIRDARARTLSIIENEWKYSYQLAADGLKKKLFAGLSKRDKEQAATAEQVFSDLVQKKDRKSIVFARMRNDEGNPIYLPLGLLAAKSSNPYLKKRIIVVQPLPRENYPAGDHPVGSWTFNVPDELAELSKPSNNALNQLGKGLPYRRDIATVKGYFEVTEPSDPSPGPEGVLMLAHQAGGNLWFTNQAVGIVSEDIKRPFSAGSVAILSACSSASSEGNNQAILEKLNRNGIDAMIISPFPVHADYGAMLAINFVREIEKAKGNSQALSLAELFSMATEQTTRDFVNRSMHFDDMDLEFLIAGDYRIIIAPKK